ncbi:MAG: hypothetical protein HYX68_29470 [Planctomycetes bacterium]|nr:hypothetical protein [Planctomycetota bacterium]
MATHPHHDDDQAKKANGAAKPAIPNLSVDDPHEEPLVVEEVIEDEAIPVVKAAPDSDALVLSDADVIEDVVEVVSDEEVLAAEGTSPAGSSAVLLEAMADSAIVETQDATAAGVEPPSAPIAAAPTSDVDLMKMFEDAPAPPRSDAAKSPEAAAAEEIEQAAPASGVIADEIVFDDAVAEPATPDAMPDSVVIAAEEEVEAASPASDVVAEEPVEEAVEAVADSAVIVAEEEVEAASPASDVVAEEAVEEAVEAAADSAVIAAEEEVEAASPASDVVAEEPVEEAVEAAADSAVIAAEEDVEAASPASDVVAEEPVEEAVEAVADSAVIAAEEKVEAASPASDVVAEEPVEEAVDAVADSAVIAADEAVEEVAEVPASATTAEDVLFDDDEVAEAAPASEAHSAELAEEVAEATDEPSSATRQAEAVLADEMEAPVQEASGAEVFGGETEFMEPGSATKKAAAGGAKAAAFDQTIAFEPPSSRAKKPDSDILVTEEELEETTEASAVDLGEMPARKSSAVSGIDPVAESIESGVDIEDAVAKKRPAKAASSVEFDELLDDLGDSSEGEMPVAKKKPTRSFEDAATEMDADAVEEAEEAIEEAAEFDEDEAPVQKKDVKRDGKKAKAAVKATGDDIDLDDLFAADEADEAEAAEAVEAFDDAEAAEAVDEEEAAEAEAAEAFDEEMEAVEAEDADEAVAVDEDEAAEFFQEDDDDVKPTKKPKTTAGKKSRMAIDDDEEVAEAFDDDEVAEALDDDEDLSTKKKKKGKEKAIVAPAAARPSSLLRIMVGMFLMLLLIGGGLAATWWFAPDEIKKIAQMSENATPIPVPKEHVETPLEKAHKALDQRQYAEVLTILQDAKEEAELSVRGEAKWFAFLVDKKAPLDKDTPEIKAAREDLSKGKNDVLLGQIDSQLAAAAREKDLGDQLAKLTAEKGALDKQLASTTADKLKAEKLIDSVADVLVKGKHIDDKTKFGVAALQTILQGLSADRAGFDAVNKILKDAEFKTGAEGINQVLKVKAALEKDKTGLLADVAAVNKELKIANPKSSSGAKGVNELAADRDGLLKTINTAFTELVVGKIWTKPNSEPRKDLVEGVKMAREKAESPLSIPLAQLGLSLGGVGSGTSKAVEQSFSLAKVFTEISYFRAREPFVESPQQKMNTYITLLQDRAQTDAKKLADITREADWVLTKESKSDDEARGKARYVQGLALRNQEKFAAAKTAFDETQKIVQTLPKAGVWTAQARKSHAEITDPHVYYIPRMDRFRADEKLTDALAEANVALKAMPAEAVLYARRALIRIDLIKGKGPKIDDEAQKLIRADADAAKKDDKFAGESAYILGRLQEEMHQWAEAEKDFRMAIKLNEDAKGSADDAGRYRVALARILLRDRDAAPAEEKKKDNKDAALPANEGRTLILHPWSMLVVSAVIAQEPLEEIEDKETLDRLKEVIEEANKLIASKNKKLKGEGYLALGKALSKLGKRTEGLKAYSDGLKLIFPGIKTDELKDLIDNHPAFQRPDVSNVPNPIMAERHFGEGLHFFWAKNYIEAEKQFHQAVKYYEKDARYQYFLGMSQLAQKTRKQRDAAVFSFEKGASLEAKASSTNPLVVRDVNASLERVQGPLRQYINTFRYKAAAAEAKEETPKKAL